MADAIDNVSTASGGTLSSTTSRNSRVSGFKRKKDEDIISKKNSSSDEENSILSVQSRKNKNKKNNKQKMKEWRDKYHALENKFDKISDEYRKVAAALYGKSTITLANPSSETTNDGESNMGEDDEMTTTEQSEEEESDDSEEEESEDNEESIIVSNTANNKNHTVPTKGNIVLSKEYSTPNIINDAFINIQRKGQEKTKNNSKKSVPGNNAGNKNIVKPPPLSIYNKTVKELKTLLAQCLGHSCFKFSIINRNLIKAFLNNSYEYTVVLKALKAHNIKFFTYTPKDQKFNSIFVKGLPPDSEPDEIKAEIDQLGINSTVTRIIKVGYNWIIQLNAESNVEEFKKIKYLQNCKVNFSDVKKNRVVQCRNCQRFNHTASNCNLEYRCVKCLENHEPGKCKIPPKESNLQKITITNPNTGETQNRVGFPIFCVNCKKEGHTANASVCEVRKQLIRKIKEARSSKSSYPPSNNIMFSSSPFKSSFESNSKPPILSSAGSVTSKVSFASVARGINNNNINTFDIAQLSNMSNIDIFKDCQKFFGMSFFDLLIKVRQFAVPYSQMPSDGEKAMALLQFFISISNV